MKNIKIFGLTALLLLFAVSGGLFAQEYAQATPGSILTSAQSWATQNRFRSAADDFIRTDTYVNVNFDKFFAYTSFDSTTKATAGYATNLGGLYLAAYYGGNFWAGKEAFNYSQGKIDFNGGKKEFRAYGDDYENFELPEFDKEKDNKSDNRIALLVGVGNMGFRFSYATTHQGFSDSDIYDGDFYKSYKTAYGVRAPQIEWALTKDILPNGIKPKVNLTLNFARDYAVAEEYSYLLNGTTYGEETWYSNNYLEPHLVINPNGLHVYNKNGFRVTADLDYELKLRIFNNDYSYYDSGTDKYKTTSIKGLNDEGGLTENSWNSNKFTPSVAAQWSTGNINFRTKLNLPIELISSKETDMAYDPADSYKLKKNGADSETSEIIFTPNLVLAAQWRLVPNKLNLNAGASISTPNIKRSTTKGNGYYNGTKVDDSDFYYTNHSFGNSTNNNLRLGFTITPTNNLSIEATCGTNSSGEASNISGNNVKVFSDNGLFSFARILVSLRY